MKVKCDWYELKKQQHSFLSSPVQNKSDISYNTNRHYTWYTIFAYKWGLTPMKNHMVYLHLLLWLCTSCPWDPWCRWTWAHPSSTGKTQAGSLTALLTHQKAGQCSASFQGMCSQHWTNLKTEFFLSFHFNSTQKATQIDPIKSWIHAQPLPPPLTHTHTQASGGGDSSVVRAPDTWLKGHGFESLQERRDNFLLQGWLSVLALLSVSVPPPCYHSST